MSPKKALLVVGTGAVGGALLIRLQRARISSVALTTQKTYEKIIQNGLKVKLSSGNGKEHLYSGEVYYRLPEDYIFEYAIITTKSYANSVILPLLEKIVAEDGSLLIFQNGIGVEDPFISRKRWTIVRAISSFGAYRIDRTSVIEKGVGKTKIGKIIGKNGNALEFWKKLLNKIGLPTIISEGINRDIWLKCIVNCVINPLTAIAGVPNKYLLTDAILKKLVNKLLNEIITVVPPELNINFNVALEAIQETIKLTAENKSSMLQDINIGRKTEIESLNGKIILLANAKGVELPFNTTIVELIKGLETKKITQEIAILKLRSVI